MKYRFNINELEKIVKESTSFREVLIKLGLAPKGGNYEVLKSRLINNNISYEHFNKNNWRKNKKFPLEKTNLEEVFTSNSVYSSGIPRSSYKIKNILIKAKLKEEVCEKCNLKEWLNNKIPLELHHVDGDRKNNNFENLQLLCPNCHSLTDNYRGKKLKEKPKGVVSCLENSE